jgi:hypothetical protein
MSKMGQFVMQMQEDAVSMTEEQFFKTYAPMGREACEGVLAEMNGPDFRQAMQDEQQFEEFEDVPF